MRISREDILESIDNFRDTVPADDKEWDIAVEIHRGVLIVTMENCNGDVHVIREHPVLSELDYQFMEYLQNEEPLIEKWDIYYNEPK